VNEIESATAEQIARLRVLWPVLNSRPEHTQEIVQAIMRNRGRLKPEDIEGGFSDAIERQPTSGWPPGPHEILGCVLKAAEVRRAIMAPQLPYSNGAHSSALASVAKNSPSCIEPLSCSATLSTELFVGGRAVSTLRRMPRVASVSRSASMVWVPPRTRCSRELVGLAWPLVSVLSKSKTRRVTSSGCRWATMLAMVSPRALLPESRTH
jgi:hypothetical protein